MNAATIFEVQIDKHFASSLAIEGLLDSHQNGLMIQEAEPGREEPSGLMPAG